ncbi:hypothetical protein OH77DRAFT_418754 [Trametes cingulata]|nr:hypothetical protein OH77DRAFT_418754 [Trametes cingulata]
MPCRRHKDDADATSLRPIREWNASVRKSRKTGGSASHAVRGLLYPAYRERPTTIWITTKPEASPECTQRSWFDDLDISRWLPSGFTMHRISYIPGTKVPLRNHYLVYISPPSEPPRQHQGLARLGIPSDTGDFLVFRSALRNCLEATNVNSAERSFIDTILVNFFRSYDHTESTSERTTCHDVEMLTSDLSADGKDSETA